MQDVKHTAIDVSAFFIQKGVTPVKLQILLYYTNVWFFAKHRKPLFADQIETWIYGPVVPNVWDNFKYVKIGDAIPAFRAKLVQLDSIADLHLNDIWNAYGHLSASQLLDIVIPELNLYLAQSIKLDTRPSGHKITLGSAIAIKYKLINAQIPRAQEKYALGHISSLAFVGNG